MPAGPGPEAAARRRARGRHDRFSETATTAETAARDRGGSRGRGGRARHGLRARPRRQGDGAARGRRAGRVDRSTRSRPTPAWWRCIWGGDAVLLPLAGEDVGAKRRRMRGSCHANDRGPLIRPGFAGPPSPARGRREPRRLLHGTSIMLNVDSIDLFYGAAQALRRSRSRPSSAASPACWVAMAWANPRCCAPSWASSRSAAGSIGSRRRGRVAPPHPRAGQARHRLRAAGARDLPAPHREARTSTPGSRPSAGRCATCPRRCSNSSRS